MDWLLGLDAAVIALIIAALAFAESAAFLGLVVPGELGLLVAGGGAALGHVDLRAVLVAGAVGAVLGAWAGYAVGARWGDRLLGWSPVQRRLGPATDAVLDHLERRGVLVVVMSRFHSVTRALAPALAGIAGMRPRMFALANVAGAVLWSAVIGGGGYLLGRSAGMIHHTTTVTSLAVVVVVVALVVAGRRTSARSPRTTATSV